MMKSLAAAFLIVLPGVTLAGSLSPLAVDPSLPADGPSPLPNGKAHMCYRYYGEEWAMHAQRHRAYGSRSVQLSFRIAKDGSVKDIAVARSSDDADADKLVTECVRGWKYNPVIKDGHPVELDWAATVSFSTVGAGPPGGDDFDIPASNRDNQTCRVMPAGKIEEYWRGVSSNKLAGPSGDNDGFECVGFPDSGKTCRAKPGNPLYPTAANVVALSTGSKIKLVVDVFTAGDCSTILPMTFKNEVPVNR